MGRWGSILESQGFAADEMVSPLYLACCLLGASGVVYRPGLRVRARLHGDTIEIRPGLTARAEAWCVAHELAEWRLRRENYDGEDIEDVANELAAELVAPRDAVRGALRSVGPRLPALAEALDVSESIAALRIGEVTGRPLALVTPRRVRVRGDPWEWGSEADVRRRARLEGERLTDVRGCAVLRPTG